MSTLYLAPCLLPPLVLVTTSLIFIILVAEIFVNHAGNKEKKQYYMCHMNYSNENGYIFFLGYLQMMDNLF